MSRLRALLRQRLIVKLTSRCWVKEQVKLVFPPELESGLSIARCRGIEHADGRVRLSILPPAPLPVQRGPAIPRPSSLLQALLWQQPTRRSWLRSAGEYAEFSRRGLCGASLNPTPPQRSQKVVRGFEARGAPGLTGFARP